MIATAILIYTDMDTSEGTRRSTTSALPQNAKDAATTSAEKSDASIGGQLNFQTPATEIMEKIVDLHNDLFFFIIVIVLFVS